MHARILDRTRERIEKNLLPMLTRDIIPVVTGFIGATESGQPTTLGRGGSDYTASILAVCADAVEVWMWTDVDGMMTTDPHEVSSARNIPHLSYEEVAELAYFGARIIHARMVGPLRDHQVSLRVKNIFKPREAGTLIHAEAPTRWTASKRSLPYRGLASLPITAVPCTEITELIQTLFLTTGNHAEVMISSQSSMQSFICFLIPTTIGPEALRTTQHNSRCVCMNYPETLWQVSASIRNYSGRDRILISGFGNGSIHALHTLEDIPVRALAQGPSGSSLSIIVDPGGRRTGPQPGPRDDRQ